ncbi:MAG TPA: biotin--[acetyl-CoA-carboxylase] ligase [Clostridia bacterium]|nr:biotin--[acetyl-CoA-carboxylase] ligase [Clostridia bacterium]
MRESILRMLYEHNGEYISGEYISKQLGITRAAVWKHIQCLQKEGNTIEAATRKGYRLAGSQEAFRPAFIKPQLKTKRLGCELIYVETLASTNLLARELMQQGCKHGTVIIAEQQLKGRGRLGRSWVNEKGKDICMSIVLKPRLETQYAPIFTLATALGIHKLTADLGLTPSIKWPNDVLISEKKFCGILLEMQSNANEVDHIIVGIGLNVNTLLFPDELVNFATSLALEGSCQLNRSKIAAELLNSLEPLYDACEHEKNFTLLLNEYKERCSTLGRQIEVTGLSSTLVGVAEGIDFSGRLLLRTEDDQVHAISAGDVTLRRNR